MSNEIKGTRPDYAKIILVGVVIYFVVWVVSTVLSAFLWLEASSAFPLNSLLLLLFSILYIIISVRYRDRIGFAVQDENHIRERSGGVLKCNECGAQTTLANQYKVVQGSFGGKPKVYCPACSSKRTASQLKKNLFFYGGVALAGLAMVVLAPEWSAGWMLLNFFLAVAFVSLATIPHELGHALTGTMLGMRVHKVVIGFGKPVYAASIFGRQVELRSLPFGGATFLLNKSMRLFRLKMLLAILAGPLVNFLIAVFLLKVYPGGWFYAVDFGAGVHPAAALQFANFLTLAFALIPLKSASVAGIIPNDGLHLMTLPFMKKPIIVQHIAAAYAYEGIEYRRAKKWDAARKCYEEALARFPNNPINLNDKALLFIEAGEFDKARDVLRKLLDSPGIEPNIAIVIKNNMAYTDAVSGRKELLPEADRLSSEAFNNMSWNPAIKGTRGAVLIELDRIDEGLILLKEAADQQEDPAGKAANYCHLAIAEARRGNPDAARSYIEKARNIDPGSNLIARAEAEAKVS